MGIEQVKVEEITGDEGDPAEDGARAIADAVGDASATTGSELPPWAILPDGLQLPDGKQVSFLKMLSQHTDAKSKGDRTVILWTLTVKDERLARARAAGVANGNTYEEFAKQMIRVFDGRIVDWSKGTFQMEAFWDEIGPKYRGVLVNWYLKTHSFSDEDRLVFFGQCVAMRTAT